MKYFFGSKSYYLWGVVSAAFCTWNAMSGKMAFAAIWAALTAIHLVRWHLDHKAAEAEGGTMPTYTPTDDSRRVILSKGREPEPVPDLEDAWVAEHMKDCAICQEFLGESK